MNETMNESSSSSDRTESKLPKLLVMVIANRQEPIYAKLMERWQTLARRAARYDIECIFLLADPSMQSKISSSSFDDSTKELRVGCEESIVPGILIKTLAAFDWYFATERHLRFDYILRTNLSSFWRWDLFLDTIARQFACPATPLFAGMCQYAGCNLRSGAGFLVTNCVARLLQQGASIFFASGLASLHDDVAISKFLIEGCHQVPSDLERFDFFTPERMAGYMGSLDAYDLSAIDRSYHFRLKSAGDRLSDDLPIFDHLLQRFSS